MVRPVKVDRRGVVGTIFYVATNGLSVTSALELSELEHGASLPPRIDDGGHLEAHRRTTRHGSAHTRVPTVSSAGIVDARVRAVTP